MLLPGVHGIIAMHWREDLYTYDLLNNSFTIFCESIMRYFCDGKR